MKNIDKEPTYYVSLTEYNEVKRMFLKANDKINALKDLLKECRQKMFAAEKNYGFDDSIIDILSPMMDEIDQVLGEE